MLNIFTISNGEGKKEKEVAHRCVASKGRTYDKRRSPAVVPNSNDMQPRLLSQCSAHSFVIRGFATTMLTAGASQGRKTKTRSIYCTFFSRTNVERKPCEGCCGQQMLHLRQAPDSRYAACDCRLTFAEAERVISGKGKGRLFKKRREGGNNRWSFAWGADGRGGTTLIHLTTMAAVKVYAGNTWLVDMVATLQPQRGREKEKKKKRDNRTPGEG